MGSLTRFVITRIALLIPMIWLLVTIVFFLLRVLPGANPALVMNPKLTNEQVELISESLGLERPLIEQYFDFLIKTITFDLGVSYRTNIDIATELGLAFGPTLMLSVFGVLIGVPLGIVMGGVAGAHRERYLDHIIRLFTIGIYSIPIFLVGIFMQMFFSYFIPDIFRGNPTIYAILKEIFPPVSLMDAGNTGEFNHYTEIWLIDTILSFRLDLTLDLLTHLLMPSLALGMLIAGVIARQVRTNMIYHLEQEYVHFARARGIPENVVKYRYALKNSVVPTIGLISLQFALLLAGAILTETTFNIPGLGRFLFQSLQEKDFPAVQGVMVLFVIIVSIVSVIGDVLYALLDPRITY
ncbi:MAG: ABC transporter permease [Candidatus Heimdallarchaeota archaeon]|nr:ABC transporter permease [Candidatus Heimdallarchaeota archaeon]